MKSVDRAGTGVSIQVEASAETVWQVVSDIKLSDRFDPELKRPG